MTGRSPKFGTVARQIQASFRTSLNQQAQQPTDDKGLRHPHLVALGYEMENLFPALRGTGGALEFFRERNIKWWRSSRSGDRSSKDNYDGPTRNLASSQIACVNFLLPLAWIPGALAAFLSCLDEDVEDVVDIIDQKRNSSPVEFEWVGWDEPLEGGRITRGANQTSIDALLVAKIPQGLRAYLCEWKYSEEYLRPDDKGLGSSGITRRNRYQHLYQQAGSSFNQTVPLDDFFFEPFYQIMRMHLLADRMLARGVTPDLQIDEAKVVVVCPAQNTDYRQVVRTIPLAQRFPELDTVEEIVRASLTNRISFTVASSEEIVDKLRSGNFARALNEWLEYHRCRYGW